MITHAKKREATLKLRSKIIKLHNLGLQSVAIAKKLGVSSPSVIRHIRLSGAVSTPFGDECGFGLPKQRRIVCDHLMGQSVGTIADKLKCADYRIKMVLWRHGVPEPEVLEDVRRKQVVWMSQSGKSVGQIAACLGVVSETVNRWFELENFVPVKHHLIPQSVKDDAIRMFDEGMSLFAIGRKLKIAPNSVRNWVQERSK